MATSRIDLEWAPTLAEAATYGVPTNLNQTTSQNGVALTWNDNGNLTAFGSTTYEWGFGNRLARVLKPGATTEYAYDSQDRRTVVIEDGVMTRTLWSGSDEVGEYDAAGALKRRFIPDGSGSMDARLATVNADGTIYWHHTDHQGSVIGTSNAAGHPVQFANYSPHGKFGTDVNGVTYTAPPTGSPFGYTGRQWDARAGLYQYRARYYLPEAGIFLSMDPVGTKDDPNLYGYVAQDPVNNTDPSGHCKRTTSPDGAVVDTGLCGTSRQAATFIASRIADPNSEIGAVEARAVSQGVTIEIGIGPVDPVGGEVKGANVITVALTDGSEVQAVTLDPSDVVTVSGRNAETGARVRDYEMPMEEQAEHEIAGHVNDRLTGNPPNNEDRAIAAENRFRERNGNDFRREGHEGRVRTR